VPALGDSGQDLLCEIRVANILKAPQDSLRPRARGTADLRTRDAQKRFRIYISRYALSREMGSRGVTVQ